MQGFAQTIPCQTEWKRHSSMLQSLPQNESGSNIFNEIRNEKGVITSVSAPLAILLNEELTLQEKLILSIIVSFESKGKRCFQSGDTIAEQLGILPSAARRSIAQLQKLGYVDRVRERRTLVFVVKKLFPNSEAKQKTMALVRAIEGGSCSMAFSKMPENCPSALQQIVTHSATNCYTTESETATECYGDRNELLRQVQQNVTHTNTLYNTILDKKNLDRSTDRSRTQSNDSQKIKVATPEQEIPSPYQLKKDETEKTVATQSTLGVTEKRKPPTPPKVPAVPPLPPTWPDDRDPTLNVRLTEQQVERLEKKYGTRYLHQIASDIERHIARVLAKHHDKNDELVAQGKQPKPFKHPYSPRGYDQTIDNFHKRNVKEMNNFGYDTVSGTWGFYKPEESGRYITEKEYDREFGSEG